MQLKMDRADRKNAWESRWANRPTPAERAESLHNSDTASEAAIGARQSSESSLLGRDCEIQEPDARNSHSALAGATAPGVQAEKSTWLAEQPEDFQVRVRESEVVREIRHEKVEAVASRAWRVPVRQGASLFFAAAVIMPYVGVLEMVLAALVGAFVGWLWHRTKAGQMNAMLIAMPFAFLFFMLFAGMGAAVLGTVLVAPFSSAMGIQREMS
jgi:hypothetical protein